MMRIIACLVVLVIVCSIVIGTLGCSKTDPETKEMMNDDEARAAKQKAMMQEMKQSKGQAGGGASK